MRRKKAGKIHENIWKDHKMLPIFTTTILFHHVLEREKLFIRNWTIDILLYIASSCMQAQNKFTQNNEKSSLFIIRKWNLALDTFFFIFVTDVESEEEEGNATAAQRQMMNEHDPKW